MLFLDFEVDEYKDRLARTQKKMAEVGLDGLVVSDSSNLIYLTGNSTILYSSKFRPFLAVVPQSGSPTLILPNLEVGIGRKTSWLSDVRGWGKGLYADAPDPWWPTPCGRTDWKKGGLGSRWARASGWA
jgi:Xaa-Pro aminopeptidase